MFRYSVVLVYQCLGDTKMENQKHEDADLHELIAQLREWLEQKPYVPDNVENRIYLRFLHSCYYDLDKAKTAADLFFSIRSSSPELMTDRDPLSPPFQKVFKIFKLALYKLSGNRNLWLCQLDDPGLQQYEHLLEAKLLMMSVDNWLLDNDTLQEEDLIVYDYKDLSMKMLMKFNVFIARKLFKFQQEAVPTRLKQIHLINAPYAIHRIFPFIKTFLSKEMMDMIHIHTPDSTTLYDFISRDDLPEEFGGTRGKLADEAAETVASFVKNRKYFLDDYLWRCDKNRKYNKQEVPEVERT